MRILLADDHDLVRDAIGTLLERDDPTIEIEKAKDFPEAFQLIRSGYHFDLVLLDIRMPGMNGLSGVKTIRKTYPEQAIVLISGNLTQSDIQSALDLGVRGVVPKTLAGQSLINAIRLVAGGELYVPADLLSQGSRLQRQLRMQNALTVRERDVLGQLRQGHSNKEIANILAIAETTVKLHMRSLSEKLTARNRTDIVIRAIDAGLA